MNKNNQTQEAEEFYKEFQAIAPLRTKFEQDYFRQITISWTKGE